MLPVRHGGKEQSILDVLDEMKVALLLQKREQTGVQEQKGKHSGSRELSGRHFRGVTWSQVDLAATLRANVGNGNRDTWAEYTGSADRILHLNPGNIRLKRFRQRHRAAILFVVDASRSQGARDRLAFVKGAVLTILARAYCDRDRVGVIVFGDRKAQTVLPYTKSVDLAAKRMEEMKAKGNTPLGMGIREALRLQKQDQKKHPEDLHLTVVLTDGKCNYDVLPGKPLLLAMAAAEQLGKEAAGTLVVDTEKGVFSMGLAKKLAEATGGEYVEIG